MFSYNATSPLCEGTFRQIAVLVSFTIWLAPAFVQAATVTDVNQTTGPDSTNSNVTSLTNSPEVRLNNDSVIQTDIDLNATSGSNSISDNTQVGQIHLGGITTNLQIVNQTPNPDPLPTIDLAPESTTVIARNEDTGAGSTQTNTTTVTSSPTIVETNKNSTITNLSLTLDSGSNRIANNTTVGPVSTGGIEVVIGVATSNQPDQPTTPNPPPTTPPPPTNSGGGSTTSLQPPSTTLSITSLSGPASQPDTIHPAIQLQQVGQSTQVAEADGPLTIASVITANNDLSTKSLQSQQALITHRPSQINSKPILTTTIDTTDFTPSTGESIVDHLPTVVPPSTQPASYLYLLLLLLGMTPLLWLSRRLMFRPTTELH